MDAASKKVFHRRPLWETTLLLVLGDDDLVFVVVVVVVGSLTGKAFSTCES